MELLTDNELIVLRCIFSQGVISANKISKITGISKISVHYILKQLIDKDLIERRTNNNRFLFHPKNPDKIVTLYSDKIHDLIEEKQTAEKLAEELFNLKNYKSNSQISYYSDPSEIKRIRANLTESFFSKQVEWKCDYKTGTEFFEGENYVFLINSVENIGIRVEPKVDFPKLLTLINKYMESIR